MPKLKPKLTITAIESACVLVRIGKTSEMMSHEIGPKPTYRTERRLASLPFNQARKDADLVATHVEHKRKHNDGWPSRSKIDSAIVLAGGRVGQRQLHASKRTTAQVNVL